MKRKNIAVILAGGAGTRFGLNMPKQFYKLAGKTVIEHTAEVFQKVLEIDEIAVVASPQYHDHIRSLMRSSGVHKCKKILCSGKERYHSTLSAINAYENEGDVNLIIHDAVRPLVSSRIIRDCIEALTRFSAVDTAIPSADTIIETEGGLLLNIPTRARFWRGQTPQCFHLEVLKRAYDKALSDPQFQTTDDCKIVHTYCPEIQTHIIQGDESNIKITYGEDIYIADRLFQLRRETIQNTSMDAGASLKGKTIAIFGASQGIGKAIGSMAQRCGLRVYAFSRSSGVDITSPESVRQALSCISEPLDAVFITAGVLKKEPIADMSYQDIDQVLDTNIRGSLVCAKEAYPFLKKSKGMLLLFSSSSYTRGRQYYGPYSASKAAVVNLTQALAEEWHEEGIKVNCINPERTATPMRQRAFGMEDPATLLDANTVAEAALKTLLADFSGQVIDVKK